MLRGLTFARCYTVDVIIFSKKEKEHKEHLEVLLCRPKNYGLTVNVAKRQFDEQRIVYLGHQASPSGVKPLAKKVEIMQMVKRPENLTDLRDFLGWATIIQRPLNPILSEWRKKGLSFLK